MDPVALSYAEAFARCYPHHQLKVVTKRINGEWKHRVFINGDAGDLAFTDNQLRDATRDFNRGR